MAVEKRGHYWYGDDQSDIRTELLRYSDLNGYAATQFADVRCADCGEKTFYVYADDEQGAILRICTGCEANHWMADGLEHVQDTDEDPLQEGCACGQTVFEVTVGVALYRNSEDVRWFYLGCRCPSCGLVGCDEDFKWEYPDYRRFLAQV